MHALNPHRHSARVPRRLTTLPEDFSAHPYIAKLNERRRRMFECADSRVDWATAELLAFGTMLCHHERTDLIVPGPPTVPHFHVRLSGQVVARDPFDLSPRVHLARSTTGHPSSHAGLEPQGSNHAGPLYDAVLVKHGSLLTCKKHLSTRKKRL
jgi:hypothetical protein